MAKAKYDWTEIQKAYECGKTVEVLTNDILKVHRDFTVSQFILKNIFRDYQIATEMKLKEITC